MTTTIMFEPISHFSCSFPLEQLQSLYGKSYYKFYQLRLRQVLTENQYRQEHYVKHSRQKRPKNQANEKRLAKEYMNKLRDKMKIQSQNDDQGKRASSVLATTKRRPKDTVMINIASTTEARPKAILKTRQSSSPTNRQRIISAPPNSQKTIHKKTPVRIPTITIDDDDDDDLLTSNAYSYTQVTSSSEKPVPNDHQSARQTILNTIMLHLNSYPPPDISKWSLYHDYDEKFSASVSSKVYRNFERIIL